MLVLVLMVSLLERIECKIKPFKLIHHSPSIVYLRFTAMFHLKYLLKSFFRFSGFIMMTPQLFINYKLKSVAHLPWRMMTYKALNTFIDDLFAFVIKMPTLYRIGCFRDGKS